MVREREARPDLSELALAPWNANDAICFSEDAIMKENLIKIGEKLKGLRTKYCRRDNRREVASILFF